MSELHPSPWALAVAALLLPAVLHAEAPTDNSSAAAPAAETGQLDRAASDTGQAAVTSDSAQPAKPSGKSKRGHKEADSNKARADTAASPPYNPY